MGYSFGTHFVMKKTVKQTIHFLFKLRTLKTMEAAGSWIYNSTFCVSFSSYFPLGQRIPLFPYLFSKVHEYTFFYYALAVLFILLPCVSWLNISSFGIYVSFFLFLSLTLFLSLYFHLPLVYNFIIFSSPVLSHFSQFIRWCIYLRNLLGNKPVNKDMNAAYLIFSNMSQRLYISFDTKLTITQSKSRERIKESDPQTHESCVTIFSVQMLNNGKTMTKKNLTLFKRERTREHLKRFVHFM